MDKLKNARAVRKAILTNSYQKTDPIIKKRSLTAIVDHRKHLMKIFQLFEDAADDYAEVLTSDTDIETADKYYDDEQKLYVEQLIKLNSAMDLLSLCQQPAREDLSSITAMSEVLNTDILEFQPLDVNHIAVHPECTILACEPELSHLQQNEPSESAHDEHISLPDIHPDSSVKLPCSEIHTCSELTDPATSSDHGTSHFISSKVIKQKLDNKYSVNHSSITPLSGHIPVSESEVTNLSQKEQLKCMASMCDEHISSPGVVSESPISPSHPEICSDPLRDTSQNYHDQQTINLHQCAIQLCIDNLSVIQTSKPVHEHDNHTGDYETLLKQLQPCLISAQSLDTVQIMCLNYSARDPSNIDSVNDSGMLVSQNLPGG